MKKVSLLPLTVLFFALQVAGIRCYDKKANTGNSRMEETPNGTMTTTAAHTARNNSSNITGDFVMAAKAATSAVVHIKTCYNAGSDNAFEQLYNAPSRGLVPVMGSGLGVTISADEYIATNNHVVENATAIEVILPDRRTFSAILVGRDPNTDLALLKVNATDLPTVKLGNPDIAQVGEWVLAVGYPLSLNTTVTAGIISAKARSIGIINRPTVNSFGSNGTQAGI